MRSNKKGNTGQDNQTGVLDTVRGDPTTLITTPAELPPTLLHMYYAESWEQVRDHGERCWQLGKWYYFEEENGR